MTENTNKILRLLDAEFVRQFFDENILPKYPKFRAISRIEIEAIKKLVWHTTYHVVIRFDTTFTTKNGIEKTLPVFCSAHSSEPRKNVYDALAYLWSHGFGSGNLTIPRPLFYSDHFNGTFYRGVNGHNLYHYIIEKKYDEIETILPRAASWLAKLHRLPTAGVKNFNQENSRISSVFPGVAFILNDIKLKYPALFETYQKIYEELIGREKRFFDASQERWLIHGDAHPENIIKVSEKKLAVIDFTDISLADFARDIGSFLQQLEYMSNKKICDQAYADKIKKIFLDKYVKSAKIKLTDDILDRIHTYYNWTTIRTASFFLTKHNPQPDRAEPLIASVRSNLKI